MMESLFSQKILSEICALNRNGNSLDFGIEGFNFLWLNPDFFENTGNLPNPKMHSHTFYEVHFILEGTYVYSSEDGQEFIAEKNSFIFIPPGIKHRIEDKIGTCRKMGFAFSYAPYVNDEFVFSDEMYCENNCDWIESAFSLLVKGLELSNGTEFDVFKNTILLLIPFITVKKNNKVTIKEQVLPDERFARAKSFIEDNSVRDISVDEVSAYVGISSKQLGRLFKQNCNMTVARFIVEARCDRVKKMLEDNSVSIYKIVDTLGFSNGQNFSRFFKRVTGITPGAYREFKGQ